MAPLKSPTTRCAGRCCPADVVPDYFSPADWTCALLKECFDDFDLISEHFYNYGGTLWRLASTREDVKDPEITSAPLAAVPASVTVPRFSVSIYDLAAK